MTDARNPDHASDALIAEAARQYLTLTDELNEATGARAGDLAIATMAAMHDLRLLAEFPCGCDDGTCDGLISRDTTFDSLWECDFADAAIETTADIATIEAEAAQ
jgi:hypothetical protein